ncbi:MAG: glycosyltransferase family 9 protein [Deltaproteobacteria bacterium]|nr:glycosyltransferase family 9 protein [Deltaproteobacteria bacterium]
MNKVLFIRRDNIGDLICTTPAIKALKLKYPAVKIGVLVNSYNADAIKGNPDIDQVFVYEKEKHSQKGRINVLLGNLNVIRRIRKEKFEVAIGCSYTYSRRVARLTYLSGAALKIGYVSKDRPASKFYNKPLAEPGESMHEVEAMMGLVKPLAVAGPPPLMTIKADPGELEKALQYLKRLGLKEKGKAVVFHISSRKPQNRWPGERFKALGELIQDKLGLDIILLWSPGNSSNPFHPGDDETAEWIISKMKRKPLAYRTLAVSELIAAMSAGSLVVCSDGGAMHIAAGLGKPIVTIWGSTDKKRWAPWGVPYRLLQKEQGLATEISSEEAFKAFIDLYSRGKAE